MAKTTSSGTGYKADGVITIGTSVDVGGINTGLKKIQNQMRKISGLAQSIAGIGLFVKLGNEALNFASDLQEVENIVEVSFKNMRYKIDAFASTCIEKFGISELAAKQTAGSFAAMGNSMGLTRDEATSMAVELTALSGDFASFFNLKQDYARTALSAVYTGETETLKRYGVVLTEANLQEYAHTLGIEKSVKAMSAREKLILRYKYIMQALAPVQGDFARTSNSWANQIRVLSERWKQFLIVLGTGLKTVLLPVIQALNVLLQAVIKFANVIGQVLSKLFGIQFQTASSDMSDTFDDIGDSALGAADSEEDLADATSAAAKAAKKAVASYDKLNVIQKDTGSAGGIGGVGGGDALDLDFGDLDFGESIFDKAKDSLMEDINSLYELGEYIGQKLTDALNKIPWDKVYTGAKNFGTGLAEFLNGLISPELFGAVGRTIASALNTAIYFALAFGTTFDWKDLGNSLAAGVNNFFATFDFAALADTIDAWVQGIWNMIVTFFTNLDYKTIFKGIAKFFTSLDPETIAILVGFFALKKAFKYLVSLHLGQAFLEGLAEGLGKKAISGGLGEIIGQFGLTIGIKLYNLKSIIAEYLGLMFHGAIDLVTKGIPQLFSNLITAISSLFSKLGIVISSALKQISTFIATFGKWLGGAVMVVAGAITAFKNFFDMLFNGFNWIKEALMVLGIALAAVGAIILGAPALVAAAVAGVVAAVATLVIVIKDNWESIKDFTIKIWNSIKDFFHKLWEGIKEIFQKALEFIKDFIHNTFELIKEIVSSVMEFMWSMIKAKLEFIKDIFEAVFGVVRDIISTTFEHIKTVFGDIKDVFDNIIQFIRDVFAGNWENIWQDIVNIFESIWNTMVDIAKYPINLVIDLINGLIGGVEAAVNFIANALSAIHFDVPDWVPGIGGKSLGFNFSGVSLPRIPQLAKGAVIPPNKEFMAILGDQKQGTNIETPLKTLIEAFNAALDARGNSGGDIIIEIDGKEVFRAVRKQNKEYKNATGKSAFA